MKRTSFGTLASYGSFFCTELGVWPGDGAGKKFVELNFRGLRAIRKNCENYVPRKFGAIRYTFQKSIETGRGLVVH